MYYNAANKRNLKTNILSVNRMFDIDKLITKDPQMYEELCNKYSIKAKECIYLIQYSSVADDEGMVKEVTEEAKADDVVVEEPKSEDVVEEAKAEEIELPKEAAEEVVVDNETGEIIDTNYPEDFQPLYKNAEHIKICFDKKNIREVTILQINPQYDDNKKIIAYSYHVLVGGESIVTDYSEDFLTDFEVTEK